MLPFSFDQLVELIQSTRPIVLDARRAHEVASKGLADYVTAVDTGVQHYLEAELPKLCPEAQLLAEEEHHWTIDPQKPYWVLDPIDGTTNLIHDYQESCVALAFVSGGQLQCSVVYNPFREETYTAVRGEGARRNGVPIHVSARPDLAHALAVVGTTPYEKGRSVQVFERIRRVFCAVEDIRRGGSAELDLCTVACGRAESFCEVNLKPWDYCAGMLIVQEAGGTVTGERGEEPGLCRNWSIAATNGLVHEELLALLREAPVD